MPFARSAVAIEVARAQHGGRKKVKKHHSGWFAGSNEERHSRVVRAKDFPVTKKLLDGMPEAVELDEVVEFFTFMRASPDLFIEVDMVIMYLQEIYHCQMDSLTSLREELEDNAEDGCISPEQFLSTITENGHRDIVSLARARQITGRDGWAVPRQLMSKKIAWRVNRDEAFATLPMTLGYMGVFMSLVILHLQIWQRQQLQRGIEEWVDGFSYELDGPFLFRHVRDSSGFYGWLGTSGMPSLLGGVRKTGQGIQPDLAISSTLLGDVRLTQRHFNGTARSAWLLHSMDPLSSSSPLAGTSLVDTAMVAARAFRATSWADRHSVEVSLTFATFQEESQMFTFTKVLLVTGRYGHAHTGVNSLAIPAVPYPSIAAYPLDAIFVLALLYIGFKELNEIRLAGWWGFYDYWTFWNVVDWTSIILGFTNCGLWAFCCLDMWSADTQGLLDWDDRASRWSIRPNIMAVTATELDRAFGRLESAQHLFQALHLVVAANAASVILRFFKAFQANERLNIVATTFVNCYQDIVHFLIVFITIFLCMAVIGHILFGGDLREFHSIGTSFNTCFMLLMGDFGWYVEASKTPNDLPSGIPRLFMVIWFLLYTFLVSIVLLNMLLAIILEKYAEACVETLGPQARTIWSQAYRFAQRRAKARGELSLMKIKADLEDKHRPSHTDELVTQASMQAAFQGMTDSQARGLMDWLQQEAFFEDRQSSESPEIERLKRTNRLLERLADKAESAFQTCESNDKRLRLMEELWRQDPAMLKRLTTDWRQVDEEEDVRTFLCGPSLKKSRNVIS